MQNSLPKMLKFIVFYGFIYIPLILFGNVLSCLCSLADGTYAYNPVAMGADLAFFMLVSIPVAIAVLLGALHIKKRPRAGVRIVGYSLLADYILAIACMVAVCSLNPNYYDLDGSARRQYLEEDAAMYYPGWIYLSEAEQNQLIDEEISVRDTITGYLAIPALLLWLACFVCEVTIMIWVFIHASSLPRSTETDTGTVGVPAG